MVWCRWVGKRMCAEKLTKTRKKSKNEHEHNKRYLAFFYVFLFDCLAEIMIKTSPFCLTNKCKRTPKMRSVFFFFLCWYHTIELPHDAIRNKTKKKTKCKWCENIRAVVTENTRKFRPFKCKTSNYSRCFFFCACLCGCFRYFLLATSFPK